MAYLWTCCISGCNKPSSIDEGTCEHCEQHYCWKHARSPQHTCPEQPISDESWTQAQHADVKRIFSKLSRDALIEKCSQLRNGTACSVDWILDDVSIPDNVMLGGMNVHIPIKFEDGVAWLLRCPRQNFTSFPMHTSDALIRQEAATLKWLEKVGLPAPRLYEYGLEGDKQNALGIGFLLIEKLEGNSMMSLELDDEQRKQVYLELASLLKRVAENPVERIGCPDFGLNGTITVGAMQNDRTGTATTPIGPFDDASSYYTAYCERFLQAIASRQLFASYAVDAYIMFAILKDEASKGRWNPTSNPDFDQQHFYLKHMDDKGDHILLDQDFRIVGLIDWTFAAFVPAYEAFGPSLLTVDNGQYFEARTGLSPDDHTFADAVTATTPQFECCAKASDTVRRATLALGAGMGFSKEESIQAFKCAIDTLGVDVSQFNWSQWRQKYIGDHPNDTRLVLLLQS